MNSTDNSPPFEIDKLYQTDEQDAAHQIETEAMDELMRVEAKRLSLELRGAYMSGYQYLHVVVPYPIFSPCETDIVNIHLDTIYHPSTQPETPYHLMRKGAVSVYDLRYIDDT